MIDRAIRVPPHSVRGYRSQVTGGATGEQLEVMVDRNGSSVQPRWKIEAIKRFVDPRDMDQVRALCQAMVL